MPKRRVSWDSDSGSSTASFTRKKFPGEMVVRLDPHRAVLSGRTVLKSSASRKRTNLIVAVVQDVGLLAPCPAWKITMLW